MSLSYEAMTPNQRKWYEKVKNASGELRLWAYSDAPMQAVAEALKVNTALTKLDLHYHLIGDAEAQAISEALKVNTTLTQLDLSDNQIHDAGAQAIAEALKVNTTLTLLDLSHNPVGDAGALSISEALRQNKTLQILDLAYNQIGYVEETVLRHSIHPTLQLHIDDQQRSGAVRCREVRVVVLGDPSVGKTSLVRGIADGYVRQAFSNIFSIANSTDGIDISTVVLREKGESMILIIWDFAGQEVYLVSHQFFLRERTVYLVLFDVREDLSLHSRLAFWLRSLHACVPNADIILVGTHIDHPSYTSERQQEQKQNLANLLSSLKKSSVSFNVRSTVYINARNSTGAPSMPELKSALFQAGQNMPFYNRLLDGQYLELRDLLRKRADQLVAQNKPPLCRWHEIVELGQSLRLSGRAIDAFMELLRFQGWVVFHRLANSATQDTSNVPALQPATLLASMNDIVILNPQWFTKTVLTGVITQKPQDRWVTDGIVTRENLLRNAWKGIDSAICDQFVLLLQRYELLYKMSDADQPGTDSASSAGTRYVIPSYLPAYKSDPSRWSLKPAAGEPHEVAIVMETKFLLEGFFSRLVVRFHERKFHLTAWRDAVLVNCGGPRALLRAHRNDSNVRLEFTARGKHPERLLPALIEILDKLSSDWYPGISWKTYLRCPMHEPNDKSCLWTLRPQVRDAVINDEQPLSCSHTHITFPKEEWLPVLSSLLQRRLKVVSQPTPEDIEALRQLEPQPAPASEIQTAATQVASLVAAQLIASGKQTLQEVGAAAIHSVREVEKQVTSSGVQQLQSIAAQSAQDLQRFNKALDGIIGSIPNAVQTDPVEFDRLIQSTVLRRIDELANSLISRFDTAESLQQEQRNEIARFFTSQVQMQLDLLDKPCPLLFVVMPPAATRNWCSKLKELYKSRHTAHLLCAHMNSNNQPEWHRIDSHPGYEIAKFSKWLKKYGSRVRSLLEFVRPFLKAASLAPGGPDVTDAVDSAITALKDPLEGLNYLQRLLDHADQQKSSSAKGKQPAPASAASSEVTHSSQEAAREWAAFLSKNDEYKSFAGLERAVVLDGGEVRWVCPTHAQEPIYRTSSISSSSSAGSSSNAPSSSSSGNATRNSSAPSTSTP
ncbi:small GTP-binding protein, variant 1 [Capsaspora owczarzaki ATCC 30864]|uniref:Small GTP-binding protein n=1 Tax=Capsaspora owczarzaki (strain ATCC 30864) TaxID=595528 RepID=E9C9A2_CAPO3|nr:small GTP-binding protein [Capsaspora owczarzaki ATCC 30864]XP_011270418.1 small GTP-binding protein, variant 2 [Capsaspora owczarzaki ATCC 30864]XP_011270419.1 small GTP-binding protein, variant 1 [Capsaspora owczarzaki ATCC 30864]KJE93980.1 small GTP-binding protein [Capsaspora owczarzaki ATCC 30864]|eukprot:XP_004347437.2 small GTP-binding protein [Capsaspora owczarzaki ATCC 30864]